MDLGLKGRTAIVCAASQGLGKASAMSLAREGVNLVIAARRGDVLARGRRNRFCNWKSTENGHCRRNHQGGA